MKRLKKIRKNVFRRKFTEQEMRAYFTKDDSKKKMIMGVFFLLSVLSLVSGFLLTTLYFEFFCTSVAFWLAAVVMWCSIRFSIQPPTDEEYDAWVHEQAREALCKELRKVDRNITEDEIDEIIYIHGFVLKGTTNAKNYLQRDVHWKRGKDNLQRYSINVFRYFHPVEYQLAVIIIDINAVNWQDQRVRNQEYFFADVVGDTMEYEQDLITDESGNEHLYRTQSFELRICDGKTVSATIRSQPLDHEEKLDTFELPSSENVEGTIARLRLLIREHKQSPAYWHNLHH